MAGLKVLLGESDSLQTPGLGAALGGSSNKNLMAEARMVLSGNWGMAVLGYILYTVLVMSFSLFVASLMLFVSGGTAVGGLGISAMIFFVLIVALLVSGANPVYATPDAQAFKKAVEKIPFVVSFSSYMDETSMNADLILPNHVYLERLEDVPVTAGLQKPMVGMVQPVVYPLHDTRHAHHGDSRDDVPDPTIHPDTSHHSRWKTGTARNRS